jgi:hypothetical protein
VENTCADHILRPDSTPDDLLGLSEVRRPEWRIHDEVAERAGCNHTGQKLNQLVTVKYRIQHVVGMTEPKVPLGEESILLMVQGQALAGVDLATLTQDDVAISGSRSVTLQLPAAKLLNVFLDEKATKVWDRRITWWTPWVAYDPDLEHKARLQALDEVRTAALEMGILDAAQRNAQNAIANFLLALHVDVSFKAPASPD